MWMEGPFGNSSISWKNNQTIIRKGYLSFKTSIHYMSGEYSMEVVACCITNSLEIKLIWKSESDYWNGNEGSPDGFNWLSILRVCKKFWDFEYVRTSFNYYWSSY
jgi:hypothetical protein